MPRGIHITRGDEPPAGGVGATFCGRPLVHDPAGLEGVDVAVLGAPFDEGVSHRPGTRYGPARDPRGRRRRPLGPPAHDARARPARGAEASWTTATPQPCPADLARSHEALAARLREILARRGDAARAGRRPLAVASDPARARRALRQRRLRGPPPRHPRRYGASSSTGCGSRTALRFGVAVEEGRSARRQRRAGGAARHLARPRGIRVDARPGLPLAHHGRDRRARPARGRPRGRAAGGRGRAARLPERRHRRARPGLRAGHRHARAGRA